MELSIRCKVYPGQFSSEYAVSGLQDKGDTFSLFAPEWTVSPDEPPTREREVDGWLKVQLYKQDGDLFVVKLPRESLEWGHYVTVGISQVRNGAHAVEAAS